MTLLSKLYERTSMVITTNLAVREAGRKNNKMSEKHLDRYVSEFAGRHNHRPLDTIDQMSAMANA